MAIWYNVSSHGATMRQAKSNKKRSKWNIMKCSCRWICLNGCVNGDEKKNCDDKPCWANWWKLPQKKRAREERERVCVRARANTPMNNQKLSSISGKKPCDGRLFNFLRTPLANDTANISIIIVCLAVFLSLSLSLIPNNDNVRPNFRPYNVLHFVLTKSALTNRTFSHKNSDSSISMPETCGFSFISLYLLACVCVCVLCTRFSFCFQLKRTKHY